MRDGFAMSKITSGMKGPTVLEWNESHPIGTKVFYWPGIREGPGIPSETRSTAWDLCGSPVVMLKGRAGGIALTHVEVAVLKKQVCKEPGCADGTITERGCQGTEELRRDGLECGVLEDLHPTDGHEFEWDGDPPEVYNCPACNPEKLTGKGLTYVAVGNGKACVLDSECGYLLLQLSEVGGCPEDVGLDFNEDEGIWKGVVKVWTHRSWEGEHDEGFSVVGEWEEVESYPEPPCDLVAEGDCTGMLKARGAEDAWACDAHAGQIA